MDAWIRIGRLTSDQHLDLGDKVGLLQRATTSPLRAPLASRLHRQIGAGDARAYRQIVFTRVGSRSARYARCTDGFEIGCDNGEKVHIAVIPDCCDREAIAAGDHGPRFRSYEAKTRLAGRPQRSRLKVELSRQIRRLDDLLSVRSSHLGAANPRRPSVSAGAKIPHEAAGQSGCAGVKNRQQMAFVGQRQGPGDEGRGALCSGSLCGSD
jgi:hypothetical protein